MASSARNSLPEFRRCATQSSALRFRHEKFNLSHRPTLHRCRRRSAATGKDWRTGSRNRGCGLAEWLSVPALPALGKARRARHSVSLRFGSARSSVFRDRTDFCSRYAATGEYPADFRSGRVFRAYDADYNMIDAEVADGSDPEAVFEKLLQNPKTAFVDARSVIRGCFTFRIQRA